VDLNKLQKKVDKGLSVLSDHDDKKDQERYIALRNIIEEVQEYIDKGVNSHDISVEMHNELKKCIMEFEKDRIVFIIFLTILCGLLFIGVFYITYSHMYDHWHPRPGGDIIPPHHTKTTSTRRTTTTVTTTTTKKVDNTTKTTSKTTTTTRTTTKTTSKTTTTTSKVTDTTTTTTKVTEKPTTSSTTTTKKTTTTQVVPPSGDDDKPTEAFVTLVFDDSSLVDLENLYPMQDSLGLKTKPTTWSLSSTLINSSKDYILTYYIDFVDDFGNFGDSDFIAESERLNIDKLKYQLLIKKGTQSIYDSGIQDMYDYPEAEEGRRPIIAAQTMNNDQSLDFELRMWLDSAVGNDQQGKKYRFNMDVYYEFEFIE